jgi:hypothetical protein
MGFGGPNPGVWGESVRKALNPDEERSAHAHEAGAEQQMLDTAELQELERSEFYAEAPQARETPEARQPSRLRSILARILRRSP